MKRWGTHGSSLLGDSAVDVAPFPMRTGGGEFVAFAGAVGKAERLAVAVGVCVRLLYSLNRRVAAKLSPMGVERETRLELATPTLAR